MMKKIFAVIIIGCLMAGAFCVTAFATETPTENVGGSIFSEGSLTMIVAFVVLIALAASIIVNVTSKKKTNSTETAEHDD